MIPVPHAFQLDLVARVRAAVGNGARIVVIQAATGAGKTTIASYMTKLSVEKGRRSLFLVHRRRLVEQISGRLKDFEVDHGVIMRGEHPYGSAKVQVASRDTILSRCFRNEWNGLPPADMIFVDEGHHAADENSEYRRILNQYPKAIIFPLSATPVGQDGKGLGPWAQAIECAAPTSQLVRDGFLVPVKCYAPDRKMHRGKAKRGIAGDLVDSWKQFAEDMPTVLFCSRVEHSRDAVDAFNAAGIPAAHVDAETEDNERDKIFAAVESGKIKVVSNVGIIKEGVDIPCLGCCQFYMDPSGRIGFLQGVGRIMRPSPGKTHGVLIDHAGAVFRHGFPDEDTEWTLHGNADAEFKGKHDAGQTEQAKYCKHCKLLYHGQLACPQCGKMPAKPPKSIFAPPPVDASGELLVEADRNGSDVMSLDQKVRHWIRCVATAFYKGQTFGSAAQIYKRKYNEFPKDGFPCMPARWQWKERVADVYPDFGNKKVPAKSADYGD